MHWIIIFLAISLHSCQLLWKLKEEIAIFSGVVWNTPSFTNIPRWTSPHKPQSRSLE